MTSKEILAVIKGAFVSMNKDCEEAFNQIERDLEVLENIKSKTLLFYSDRKKIAQEYEKWCKDNNAMITNTTNMITWLLCFKLKEWLGNENI